MKKGLIFDIVFIILLGILLTALIVFGKLEIPAKFLFIPLLTIYFIGRYVSILSFKKKA